MSGGHFDYLFYRVDEFADRLEIDIENNQKKNEWGYCRDYSHDTIARLREVLRLCRHTARLMKEVEWLFSGDIDEKEFWERMGEIEENNDASN